MVKGICNKMLRCIAESREFSAMHRLWKRIRLRRLALAGISCAVIIGASVPSVAVSELSAEPKKYQFSNGRWFDGEGFRRDTFYVVDGLLTRNAPAHVDEVVDLHDGFVVPPFGEAHNHNVEGAWNIDTVAKRYLDDGVFYVKIPGNIGELTDRIRSRINLPASVDVTFSNGGLTATGGHPAPLYEEVLSGSRYAPLLGPVDKGWFNNRGYFFIDSEHDLLEKWKLILSGKPDFIKIFLAHSEDFDRRKSVSTPNAHSGLNPKLVPVIVRKAHDDGLRVSCHVETAEDFRRAVDAGVDEITHVPGWWIPAEEDAATARLTEDDADRAASTRIVIVTTTVAASLMPGHGGQATEGHHHHGGDLHSRPSMHRSSGDASTRDVMKANLLLLHRKGARIAIGSDHAETSVAEALNLRELGVFDNLTLLKLWCEHTPKAIFPDRRIGRFQEGYEASFLVLAGNPIERFDHVTKIVFRMKQGHVLMR